MPPPNEQHELDSLHPPAMEEEERGGSPVLAMEDTSESNETQYQEKLNKRVVRKLDYILLPFLALLFLLNSLDKSNIGNAETAGFTHDAGLSKSDLNISLAVFFAVFVALQPVGAALGRRYGMARWVPACMTLWGLSTILHIWVKRRWQLICLRIAIASLEAGFYPTTVSYLSLFYTRYEFAVRLGFFYGQTAVAGVLGGILSWAVFSRFETIPPSGDQPPPPTAVETIHGGGWKSWQVLFLIEGCTTMIIALTGFFLLPHSADSAWFFGPPERMWAEQRIKRDYDSVKASRKANVQVNMLHSGILQDREVLEEASEAIREDEGGQEDFHRLLEGHTDGAPIKRKMSTISAISVTADSGLSRHDILSAIFNYKIWHLLICNILSAIPATAFGVFLPLVVKQLSPSLSLSPASSNLLAAPPFAFGAVVLFIFMRWSDRSHQRLVPILWGLGILLLGLIMTVMVPVSSYILRYLSLCVLLSGSYMASPLTVAWLSNNTPEPGKRAILLGINGWGNLAGVFSALLFRPEDEANGYVKPFIVTLVCVVTSFAGYISFWTLLVRENKWRDDVTATWSDDEKEREELMGDTAVPEFTTGFSSLSKCLPLAGLREKLAPDEGRRGDEKLTFRYSL